MARNITYRDALREALREEMDRDERVILMGEDIGAYGGSYVVTRGFLEDSSPTATVVWALRARAAARQRKFVDLK